MSNDKKRLARGIVRSHGIPLIVDFHTLTATQCATLAQIARLVEYRAPANRNGSTARYFHAYLQR